MEDEAASRDQAELDCGGPWTVVTVQYSPQSRESPKRLGGLQWTVDYEDSPVQSIV